MLLPRFRSQRAFLFGSAAVMLLLPVWASAQSQSDNTSVADAARRAREQKKNAAKPARTLTNDDLPAARDNAVPSAAAAAPAPEAATSDQAKPEADAAAPAKAAAPAEPAGQTEDSSKKRSRIEAALKQAKAELTQAQNELDILQRKSVLDSDAFYSKTDYARDTEGKARLDADAQQVNDKKSQVDELKTKVAALQAELGEAAEADRPAQPQ
jgi:hypothetical protein